MLVDHAARDADAVPQLVVVAQPAQRDGGAVTAEPRRPAAGVSGSLAAATSRPGLTWCETERNGVESIVLKFPASSHRLVMNKGCSNNTTTMYSYLHNIQLKIVIR